MPSHVSQVPNSESLGKVKVEGSSSKGFTVLYSSTLASLKIAYYYQCGEQTSMETIFNMCSPLYLARLFFKPRSGTST